MKLADVQLQNDNQEKIQQLHAIEAIVTDYGSGHFHYAHALKQLCHHGLTIQQAEQRLSNP